MEKPAESWSPITSQVCNGVLFEVAKRRQLNGSVSSFSKIVLLVKTSMYTLIRVESSIPILMSEMSLPTGTTRSIRQKLIRPIKMGPSNTLTDLLVIMFVLSLKVLLLISNSSHTPSFTIFVLPMRLTLLSKTPLVSSRPLGRRETLTIFAPLAVVYGSVLQANAKLSLNPIHKKAYFLDLSHTLLKTVLVQL